MKKFAAAMLTLLAVLAMPTASALDNTTFYFVPQDGTASSCGNTVVQVMADAPYGLNAVQFAINHTSCIEIVDVEFNPDWWQTGWNNTEMCFGPGHDWIKAWRNPDLGPGDVWVCNITLNCIDPSCSYCETHMDFTCGVTCLKCGFVAGNYSGGALPVNATDGTFTCGAFPSAETFSKPLYIGWNLISLPLDPAEDNSASAVLSTVSYNAVYRYNATSKQFEDIASTDAMNPGTGYFVHVTADCTWKYDGTAKTSMDISLKQGLNMIGWLNCSKDIGDALSSSDDYYYAARWNTSAQKFEVHNPAALPAFNDFTTMDRGTGYFVSAEQDAVLSENC